MNLNYCESKKTGISHSLSVCAQIVKMKVKKLHQMYIYCCFLYSLLNRLRGPCLLIFLLNWRDVGFF